MNEPSREEQIKRRIQEIKERFEIEKGQRIKRTFLYLSIGIYVIAFMEGAMWGSIADYLAWLLIAPIIAVVVMFASALVLLNIITGAINHAIAVAKLEGELNAIEYSKWN